MDKSALIPLAEAGEYPQSEVGTQVKQLAELQKKGIPIANTVVILRSTLEKIVEQSNLAQNLREIIDADDKNEANQDRLLKRLQNAVKQVNLPNGITKEILTWHSQHPSFVKVFTSDMKEENVQENIDGDANLIDSILHVWSQQISLDFQQRQLKLFAQPILIQHQGQPQSSGIAFTQSPTHKTQVRISSVWGVFDHNYLDIEPDQFEVDLRTQQLTQQQLNPQYIRLQRKADQLQEKPVLHYNQDHFSLQKSQVLALAHLVITIKRIFLGDYLVSWFLEDDKFFITQLTLDSKHVSNTSQFGKIILTGDSIQPGIITGTIFHLTHKNQIGQLHHGQIITVHQLTPDYLPALTKVAAIICDQGLSSPMISKHITQYSLPTIINTRHATRYLTPGLSVVVNANSGQVLSANKNKNRQVSTAKPNLTKTYISAGNPRKAAEYVTSHVDGVGVLRSEYTFASLGEHPKYLLNSKKRATLKAALKKTIQAYRLTKKNLPLIYRTLDLTSQEFKALAYANNFEPDEPNPYLGYRGGIRTLNNFDLLDLEMEVLQEIASVNNVPLGLMLPFVRTSSELQLIKNYLVKKHHFDQSSKIGLYLQLNTPENILQIEHYLSSNLSGVSFNARSIHALTHGIDPDNPDIFTLYPYDIKLMTKLLTKTIKAVKTNNAHSVNINQPTQALLHLEDNSLTLVEIATKLGYDVVTVKPEFAPRVKQRIGEIETQHLQQALASQN